MVPEQTAKRQKVDRGSQAEKAVTPKNVGQVTEKTLERTKSEGVLISNGSKANSPILQLSLRNTSQTSSLPASLPNRFKLDNRSTSFRILPPLPADFASVSKPLFSILPFAFFHWHAHLAGYVIWEFSTSVLMVFHSLVCQLRLGIFS